MAITALPGFFTGRMRQTVCLDRGAPPPQAGVGKNRYAIGAIPRREAPGHPAISPTD